MRHQLEYPWTLSYKPRIVYKQQQSERDWLLDYKTIYVIKDIESFWGVYNNIPSLTDMPAGSIYAMFKNGINPSWEDPENKTGFSWILYGSKNATKAWINKIYEATLLTLIGCQYKYEECLNGCSFERKAKGDKFVFWFKSNRWNHYQNGDQKGDQKGDEKETIEISQKEMLDELLVEIGVKPEDYVITDEDMKIDWKSFEYKHKKVCIKLVQHCVNTETKTSQTSQSFDLLTNHTNTQNTYKPNIQNHLRTRNNVKGRNYQNNNQIRTNKYK